MREDYNWKSLFIAAGLIIVGIILFVISASISQVPWKEICMGIGCSLIASSIVIFTHDLFIDKAQKSELTEWGIDKIYNTRAERNADSDPNLDKARYKVDAVAFGLSSFRTKYTKKVERCLRKGVSFRFLVMDPTSVFIAEREKIEGGTIKPSIMELVAWADRLNADPTSKGKIIVKGYNTMTLDFYWRVDDELYIGPYWYHFKSSDTITYKFNSKGKAFQVYTDYFDTLWEDKELTRPLTKIVEATYKSKRKQ